MKKYLILIFLSPIILTIFVLGIMMFFLELFMVGVCFIINEPFTKKYSINLILSTDQKGNTISFGDPDETISSRAGRVWPESDWCKLIDCIMFYQTDHCHKAIEKGEGKRDLLFPVQ